MASVPMVPTGRGSAGESTSDVIVCPAPQPDTAVARAAPVANPTIESLDDVKVRVHTYDAEMGRTGGGVFNTTLKSGSNSWHGTAFFQTRPSAGTRSPGTRTAAITDAAC